MSAPIRVPAGFKSQFDYYCERAGLDRRETNDLRNAVRADFDDAGNWIIEQAAIYRFIDETWRGDMPTADLCRGYLASKGWFAEDETIFERWGIMLLAGLCASVAGALPQSSRR